MGEGIKAHLSPLRPVEDRAVSGLVALRGFGFACLSRCSRVFSSGGGSLLSNHAELLEEVQTNDDGSFFLGIRGLVHADYANLGESVHELRKQIFVGISNI